MSERLNAPEWATYLRVSNEDKQTPERSFAMQRQRIQEQWLAPSELPFKREYCDIMKCITPNRADYQQMLEDADAGRFSHLALIGVGAPGVSIPRASLGRPDTP